MADSIATARIAATLPAQGISGDVLREKYAKGDERSPDEVRARVARALAAAEAPEARAQWEARFLDALRGGFVPAVPFDVHSSSPAASSNARKTANPPAAAISPGAGGATSRVPAALPSLCHNSTPLVVFVALKNTLLLKAVRLVGLELSGPGLMLATSPALPSGSTR